MTLNKWLSYLILGGLFILPVTPLIVSSSLLFPFITGKAFFFRIVVEVIFAAWIVLMLRDASYRPPRSTMLVAMGFLTLILVLATVFSVSPARSFWSNFERMDGLLSYLHLAAYFVILAGMMKSEKLWRRLFQTSLAVSVAVSLYGVVQLLGGADIHQGGVRVDASLGNATYLAVYLLFHIFLAAWLWGSQSVKNKLAGSYYGAIIGLELITLYFTATRGAILGLISGVLLIALLHGIFNQGKWRRIAVGTLVIIVILISAFIALRNTAVIQNNPVLSRFANISVAEATTASRLTIWQMSLQGFKEHPVLGWGPENYNLVFNKYYRPEMWRQEPWFDRSHNVFFDWLINAGVLGLLGYLSLFVITLWSLWCQFRTDRTKLAFSSLFAGLLAAYFIHNIFVFDNLISYLLFFTVICYLTFMTNQGKSQVTKAWPAVSSATSLVIGVVVIGALAGSLYYFNFKPIGGSQTLIKAISPASDTLPAASVVDQRINYFHQAITASYLGRGEAREQLIQVAYGITNDPKIPADSKQKILNLAFNEMNMEVEDHPLDARPAFFLGNFLLAFGQYKQALPFLQKAAALSPNKQAILFGLSWAELKTGQVNMALERLATTAKTSPDYLEAAQAYAAALDEIGRTTEAVAVLRDFATRNPNQKAEVEKVIKSLTF